MKKQTSLRPDREKGSFYCYGMAVQPPQTSIHPRVRNGRTVFPKSNTAKPKKA
jgi:hypothetical protein